MYIIGIDVGGSATKIIALSRGRIIDPMLVKADDPIASLYGAFGKFAEENNINLSEITHVMVTGVGAHKITKPIYNLPTYITDEFIANGLGGLYLSGASHAVIVSMGTGTSVVYADGKQITHLGGTGVGGGTIAGLSKGLLGIRDLDLISKLAEEGDVSKINLSISDIVTGDLHSLPSWATASNFGKFTDDATKEDIALGIFTLVFENIAALAAFASKSANCGSVVFIGKLTSLPQCAKVFADMSKMYKDQNFDINFIIPNNSEYGTAIGAALSLEDNKFARRI